MQLPPLFKRKGFTEILEFYNSDARHYQLSFLAIFLSTGLLFLGFGLHLSQIALTFSTCLLTQFIALKIFNLPITTLKSASITSFSLCLMFRSDELWIIALAAFLSIASKFIFKIKGKHIFNPANFGICTLIFLTHQAWISPGQWGSSGIWWFIIGILGLLVTNKAKRFDTALAFFLSFGGLMAYRILIFQNWPVDFLLHQFNNGSLLLFTFFMITDPASTPSHKIARIVWAVAIGALAFWMQAYQWINGSPVWALFIVSMITPLIDYFFKAERFQWTNATTIRKPIIN